jgi:hypothetical protein
MMEIRKNISDASRFYWLQDALTLAHDSLYPSISEYFSKTCKASPS